MENATIDCHDINEIGLVLRTIPQPKGLQKETIINRRKAQLEEDQRRKEEEGEE
jgi:hypothetical protein